MAKSTSNLSRVAAGILYIVNIVVMVVCVFLLAFGIWIIVSPASLTRAIQATGSTTLRALLEDMLTLQVGIAVTSVAALLFFICFMGFYGTVSKSPFLLFMYAALVLLLLLLECALLYYFSSNLFEKGLQDDGQWTHAMRIIFKCCEQNATLPIGNNPPWSCCGPEMYPNNCTASFTYEKDCRISIQDWYERYQLPIYLSLAVLHIILAFCSIIRRLCSASHSYS